MAFEIGDVLEGKVKSITNYGAFVGLPDGSMGLVHISEVANSYVTDIHDHLSEGQSVQVKLLANEKGKLSLSIKQAQPKPASRPVKRSAPPARGPQSFEDKLKQFLSDSSSKLSDNRLYNDHRTKTRKR